MEQNKNSCELLDQLGFPAFIVRDGIICEANPAARQRNFTPGDCAADYIGGDLQEYASLPQGRLCLTLYAHGKAFHCTVLKAEDCEIFYLEPEISEPELRALALASQNLKAPLADAMLCADLLEGAQRQALQHSLYKLHRAICNMGDAANYDKKRSARLEAYDASSVIAEIMESAGSCLEKAGICLQYTGSTKAIYSLIDREKLERGILNMLSNAAKYSIPATPIQAQLRCDSTRIRVSVVNRCDSDSSAVYAKLFSAFEREPGMPSYDDGIGLGMRITRSAAFAHGGMLLFDRPEEGAVRLTLSFPVQQSSQPTLRSPILYPVDYSGGYSHVLTELSDVLPDALYI